MEPVRVTRGDGPVVLGFPHVGIHVPDEVAARLNDEGKVLRDTDWHIDQLYADLIPGLTMVAATHHRYVIDLNRDPGGQSLYPGQTTTELIPRSTFDNAPIWQDGREPDDAARATWITHVHRPYHAALEAELARVRARHGIAILYDCHSIRSRIPWLFDGVLPDLNIGTDGGRSCAPEVEAAVVRAAEGSGRSFVLNGRFRGGWTTRHYGRPEDGIHAVQMELAQSSHLTEEIPPFRLDAARADALRPVLAVALSELAALAPTLTHQR